MIAFPKQVTGLECPGMKYKRREWQRREKTELSSTEGRGLTRPGYKMCIFPTVFPRARPSCIVLLFLFSPHFLSSSQGASWEDMLGCGSVLKIIFAVLSKKTICWREAQSRLIRNSLILLAWTEWWDMWIELDDGKVTDAEPKIKPSPRITHLLLHSNPASTTNHWWQDTHRWSLNQSAEETQMGHWGALQEIISCFPCASLVPRIVLGWKWHKDKQGNILPPRTHPCRWNGKAGACDPALKCFNRMWWLSWLVSLVSRMNLN